MEKLINILKELNNAVVISNHVLKNTLIKKMSESKQLINVTFKTFNEVVDDLVGSYSSLARIELSKSEGISSELADILLYNSLIINDDYQNQKIYNLHKIRNKYQQYLTGNPYALNIYRNRVVFVVNDYETNELFKKALNFIKNETEVVYYKINPKINKNIKILEFSTIKAEVTNLMNEVAKLLENNVEPKYIKIHSLPSDYHAYVKEVFNLSGIDIDLSDRTSLYSYELTKIALEILKKYQDENIIEGFQKTIEELKALVTSENYIIKTIVNVLNTYVEIKGKIKDIYQDLIYTFKSSLKSFKNFKNVITVTNLLEETITKDDYIFILGFNQDVFPKTYLNEDYLLDFEKEKLGIPTSKFKNHQEKIKCERFIDSCKNLYISYPVYTSVGKTSISSFIQRLKELYPVEIVKCNIDYKTSYSSKLDILNLGKKLDLYYKYDVKNDELYTLYSHYTDSLYRKYSHEYTGIDSEQLDNFLKKNLLLSYTSIDEFYKCSFLYYLEKVLKIKRSSNEDALYIGNLFHECLNKILLQEKLDNVDEFLDKTINEYLNSINKIPTKKEMFFINKYKVILKKLYENLQKQLNNSDFTIFGLEKEFTITLNKKYTVTLNGKIDKVLTLTVDGEKYAVVLDYKSGNTDIDLNRIIYGLNMQIMFYFYFLNKFSEEKYHFAGGYLQKVLPNSPFNYDPKFTYEEQFNNFFKLVGYSNRNQNILKRIDYNFGNEDRFLYGIRLKQNGDFDFYSLQRVISEADFWELLKIVDQKINEAIEEIFAGNFHINPKKLGNIDSCSYCKYKDICYRENNDYQELDQHKNFDFLVKKEEV